MQWKLTAFNPQGMMPHAEQFDISYSVYKPLQQDFVSSSVSQQKEHLQFVSHQRV